MGAPAAGLDAGPWLEPWPVPRGTLGACRCNESRMRENHRRDPKEGRDGRGTARVIERPERAPGLRHGEAHHSPAVTQGRDRPAPERA